METPLNPTRRHLLVRSATALAAMAALPAVHANVATYPDKPVRLTVGFAAGGGADIVARQLGAKLAELTGQQFLVDNRPGATGTIAAAAVAKSPADGYNVMLCSQSTMVLAPAMYSRLQFDPVKDFVPVTRLVSMPLLLVVHPSVQANSVRDLLGLMKAGNGMPYASSGLGGPQHISAELFQFLSKTKLTHVPYKGEAPALGDVIGGQVPMMFANLPAALPHVRAGRLKVLAISSARRHPAHPDIPTVAEAAGMPEFEVETWYGLFAPAGTPAPVLTRLQNESIRALKTADLASKLEEQGYSLIGSTQEQFAAFMKAELPRWGRLVREADIRAD